MRSRYDILRKSSGRIRMSLPAVVMKLARASALAAGLVSILSVPLPGAVDSRVARGGAGYFMFGAAVPDIGGLNAALERAGYSRFPRSFFTVGGGGHAFIGRLVLGGEGQALMERRGRGLEAKTVLSGGCGFFDLGYLALSGRAFMVYPLFGIGAGALNLGISGREAASFPEILEDPGRNVRLQKSGFLMQIALGADRWIGPGGRAGRRGFFVGVRAGYVLAPAGGSWELEGTDVPGGPKAGWAGPYLRIVIGAGGGGQ